MTDDVFEFVSGNIEWWALAVCVPSFIFCGLLGLVTNLALLVASRCKKSVRNMHYALIYNLAFSNFMLCGVWAPLDLLSVVLAYNKLYPPVTLCYVQSALFHLLLPTIFITLVFIVIKRMCKAAFYSAKQLKCIAVLGLVSSWLVGVAIAATSSEEYPRTMDYLICTGDKNISGTGIAYIPMGVCIGYLVGSLVLLTIVMLTIRVKLHQYAETKYQSCHLTEKKDGVCKQAETSLVEVAASPSQCTNLASTGTSECNTKESADKTLSVHFSDERQVIPSPAHDSDHDDDDLFDLKMRLKLQKSGSGRRHTVANIGVGDSLFGGSQRRGSLEDSNPHSKKAAGYQYVRKWSVDITALQEQLENPKMHLNALPLQDILKDRKPKPKPTPPEADKEEKKTTVEINGQNSLSTKPLTSSNKPAVPNLSNSLPLMKPPPKKPLERGVGLGAHKPLESSSSLLTSYEESIAEVEEEEEEDPKKQEKIPLQPPSAKDTSSQDNSQNSSMGLMDNVNKKEELSFTFKPPLRQQDLMKLIRLTQRDLMSLQKCATLIWITLLTLLPYIVVQLCQLFTEMLLNRNLSIVAVSVVLIPLPFHIVLVSWMEKHIQQSLSRLRTNMAHLQCVCYCNIGKTKQCLGPKPASTTKTLEVVAPATTNNETSVHIG